ncbi:hypothetical protein [Rouxiella sp. Mn2063]|uniref:hypothetical protein n=1 Tax=Rouxiella sp. Mn2063 TaxID=3395262 RepID=UPI003BD77D06
MTNITTKKNAVLAVLRASIRTIGYNITGNIPTFYGTGNLRPNYQTFASFKGGFITKYD